MLMNHLVEIETDKITVEVPAPQCWLFVRNKGCGSGSRY